MCRFQWKDPRPQIDEEPWSLPRGPNAWDATPFQSTKPSPPDCIDIALIYGQKIAARRCSSHHGSNPWKHPLPTFGVRIINDTSIDHDVNALMGTISIQSVTLNGETATEHQAISMSWVVCGHIINSDWKRQISLGQNSDTSSSIPWCSKSSGWPMHDCWASKSSVELRFFQKTTRLRIISSSQNTPESYQVLSHQLDVWHQNTPDFPASRL